MLKILKSEAGLRIDKFLALKYSKYSRSKWQEKIKLGLIRVCGKIINQDYILKEGDIVSAIKEKKAAIAPFFLPKPEIVYENNDVIVVVKPSGVVAHQTSKIQGGTLADSLLKYFPQIKKVGPPGRWGIVHRLDKDASGLLLVAKNQKAFDWLQSQFKERKVEKEYTALVRGRIKDDRGKIDFPLGRAKSGKMAVKKDGRPALTEYEVLKCLPSQTLVKIKAKTGRMHQIRVHFTAIGRPIVGDKLYGPKKKSSAPRLYLHASRIGFYNLQGDWLEFVSPPNFDKKIKLC